MRRDEKFKASTIICNLGGGSVRVCKSTSVHLEVYSVIIELVPGDNCCFEIKKAFEKEGLIVYSVSTRICNLGGGSVRVCESARVHLEVYCVIIKCLSIIAVISK